MSKAKEQISVRLHAADLKFLRDCVPARQRSAVIQRAVANAVIGLKAMRQTMTHKDLIPNGGAVKRPPRWSSVVSLYLGLGN